DVRRSASRSPAGRQRAGHRIGLGVVDVGAGRREPQEAFCHGGMQRLRRGDQVGTDAEPALPLQVPDTGRGSDLPQALAQRRAAAFGPAGLGEADDETLQGAAGMPRSAPRHAQNIPVSSRAASDIMWRFQGGSNTSSTSASATVGISSSASRTSATRMSPMPQPGAVRVMRTVARYSPSFSG